MRSPWSRFSILLLPDPGLVLRLRSSDSLISGETATFQSYRSSLAHLSSIGNTKHLFVLTKISGDVPDVPSTPGRLFVGRGCCQLVHAPTIALHLWTSHQAQNGSTLYHPVQWLQKTVTDQKDAETHINTAVTHSHGVWGGPYWPEQAGSGRDVGHASATSGGSWIWMNTDANPWDSFRLMGVSTSGSIGGQIW